MKILAAAAVLMLLPATGFAQTASPAPAARPASPTTGSATGGAAATLPNTFDAPASAPAAAPRAPRTAAPAAPAVVGPVAPRDPAEIALSETALRTTIAAIQTGAPNYAEMTPGVATRLRGQIPTITPLISGFGALKSIEYVGQEDEAELFVVVFDKAATQWIIARDEAGKIAALLFRPVAAAESAS